MNNLTLNLLTAMTGFCDPKHIRTAFRAPWIVQHKNGPFLVASEGHAIAAVRLKTADVLLTPGTAVQLPYGKLVGIKHGSIVVKQINNVIEFSGQYQHKAVALTASEYDFVFGLLKIFAHKSSTVSAQTANDAAIDMSPKHTIARDKLLVVLHTDSGNVKSTPTSVFNCYENTKINGGYITRLSKQHTATAGAHILIMAFNYGHNVVTAAPLSMFE